MPGVAGFRPTASHGDELDKRDTTNGWVTVGADAAGVPYSALLYQRYVGGVWRQVQDAYSEVKGDNLLEIPISKLFDDAHIPYYRTPSGVSGASAAAAKFGLSPGPDFVLPEDAPTVIIEAKIGEAKIGEDGGTVRDKASRIKNLADFAHGRGLLACAVVDGKGWSERPTALADVIIATGGRTYTLSTLPQILEHNAAAGRAVSVVVNVVSEERIGDAQHGDDLAHGDVLGDRHGQLDELFRTELVHDLGEEFIVDGIVVVPEAVSERERCPLASRQPRIVDLAVHHRIGQFLLDALLSRPGQKTSVASIVALVEAGDPEAGDLLGA